jgi:hypothetical protein
MAANTNPATRKIFACSGKLKVHNRFWCLIPVLKKISLEWYKWLTGSSTFGLTSRIGPSGTSCLCSTWMQTTTQPLQNKTARSGEPKVHNHFWCLIAVLFEMHKCIQKFYWDEWSSTYTKKILPVLYVTRTLSCEPFEYKMRNCIHF